MMDEEGFENDYAFCESCDEEYYLPEDVEDCPFCGKSLS